MKFDDILTDTKISNVHSEVIHIDEQGDPTALTTVSGDELPVLPLRNMVLFPQIVMPVSVGRDSSLKLVHEVYDRHGELMAVMQRDHTVEDPQQSDLFDYGTVARILRIIELPDNTTMVILHGRRRARIMETVKQRPYLTATVDLMPESAPDTIDEKTEQTLEAIKILCDKIVNKSSAIPNEVLFAIEHSDTTEAFINFVCGNLQIDKFGQQKLLETHDLQQRANLLVEILTQELQQITVSASIQSKVLKDIDKQQREYFLQQQMKTIKNELGDTNSDKLIDTYRERAKTKKWDSKTADIFNKELKKLEMMPQQSPDFAVQQNYVETLLDLPWNEYTKDNFDLKKAQKILDRDHFGLDKVKERIIEHLAVLKLRNDLKAPILCLYGPPGVGKTSLGKSIAESLGRKYVRVSLGGMHDEAEIRGHRRTYIGAMPGRIIQNLKKVGSSNPVFVLDEIDKLSDDIHGDPSSALLEVLDPEQNAAFHDNFLDIDYDLSKVLFIATANDISAVPRPLRDRMELIEVSGYIAEEKVEIAAKHLVPKQLKEHGIDKKQLKLPKNTLRHIVDNYTRESGVRELDRVIAKIMRKTACKIATETPYETNINIDGVKEYLGTPRYTHDNYQGNDICGVVTGLAWTAVGGEILYIEVSLSKSKTPKLTLTGNLGDVMKESAMIALEYLKAHADNFNIDAAMFDTHDVHIHVPEGAIPKDGPSAGITMLTALASAFTKRKVKKHLAMTGEITLRGKLLPVGGIKEKILAAKRAGITDILMCADNKKDIDEINDVYVKGLKFHFTDNMTDALKTALL
ncbi:MAG: endopeptidase La [Paludibacteraceae bacterium]